MTGRVLDAGFAIDSAPTTRGRFRTDSLNHPYEPASWLALAAGLRGLRVRPEHAFMDIGCGKGRVVFLASWYRFGRVVGVDLDAELVGTARRNMASARGPSRVRFAEIIEQDARTVRLPPTLRVAFLFNPFVGPVFRTVAERLTAHCDRTGNPLRLIYANPEESPVLRRLGFEATFETRYCTAFDYLPSAREQRAETYPAGR